MCRCEYCSEVATEVDIDEKVTIGFKEGAIYFDHRNMRYKIDDIYHCPFCGRQLKDKQEVIDVEKI